MLFARAILGQELILLGAIGLAMGLVYACLRWRGQLGMLRRVWLPALLWAIFGPLDALVTIVGTWGNPLAEGNPLVRAWLIWGAWVGQVLYTFLYVLFWAAVVSGLEALRRRVGGIWAYLLGAVQLLVLYTLAVGHLAGFLSWTVDLQPLMALIAARAPWLFADTLLSYLFNFSLFLGASCTALHLASAALARWMGSRASVRSQAPSKAHGLAAPLAADRPTRADHAAVHPS